MPPFSVLCAPGAAVLTTTGKPRSRATDSTSSGEAASRSATSGNPYASNSARVSLGGSQTSDESARAADTTRLCPRGGRSPPRGNRAGGPPQPVRARSREPEGGRGRVRVGERRDAARFLEQRLRNPALADHDGEHGLVLHRRSARPRARPPPPPLPHPPSQVGRSSRSRHRRGCRRARAEARPRTSAPSRSRACRSGSRCWPRAGEPPRASSGSDARASEAPGRPPRRRPRTEFRGRPRWSARPRASRVGAAGSRGGRLRRRGRPACGIG